MKTNKVISNILLFLIGISFVYVIVKMFNINFVEGFKKGTVTNINDNLSEVYDKTVDISNNMFSDYDASQNFYNSSGNMIPQILSKLNDLSLKLETTNNLKCVANFGTKIGEPLSGGIGVLRDTNYICPEELPNCAGMLCDEKYGVCTK